MLARQMLFAAVARIVGESWYRVYAICAKYVELAVDAADLSDVRAVAIDETSCQRGHDYLTLVADAVKRQVIFVTAGKDAKTVYSKWIDGADKSYERGEIDAMFAANSHSNATNTA